MSLLPYFYNLPRFPRSLLHHNFGLPITPDDLMTATSPIMPRVQPWWPRDSSSIKTDNEKWQINVDVQHFSPEEVTVKITDGFIVIEGKHEEKEDEHGFISRCFVRRFKLGEDFDPDAVESRLSSDGVLTVVAPKKADIARGERSVPITHTGPIRKDVLVDDVKKE